MLFIKGELENYSHKIESKQKELKELIRDILESSQELNRPEKNIYNLKQDILIEVKDNLHMIYEVLDKFEEDMRIKEIRNEISFENITIKISNIYSELEKIKKISIPQIDEMESFFREYNRSYEQIIGSLKGDFLLKSIEEKYFVTKFDKNFITLDDSENRKKLLEVEKFYNELANLVKNYENLKMKFNSFLELTQNFLEQKELLEIALEKGTEEIYESAMKELDEKQQNFLIKKQEEYNNILNKVVGEIYLKNKERKKLLFLKSKKIIQTEIEESINLEKAIEKILIYLNITSKERELLENLDLLLKEKVNEEINIFKFKTSYKICQKLINDELEKEVKLNSKILKNSIQELVEVFKLTKKILTEEVINTVENRVEFSNDMRRVLKVKENILEELEDRIEMKYPHLKNGERL